VKTTKITATFLAIVLVTGALTFGTSILVGDAFASGDKKKHDRYYDDYDKKDRYYDDYDKKDRYYDDYDKKDRYYDDYDKKDREYKEYEPRY
jgi:hypothetical protein